MSREPDTQPRPAPRYRGVALPRSWGVALAAGWAGAILLACWVPDANLPASEDGHEIPNLDKAIHFGLFAVFGALSLWAEGPGARSARTLAIGATLAVVSELGQAMPFVNREPGLADAAADLAGLLASCAVIFAVRRRGWPRARSAARGLAPQDVQ